MATHMPGYEQASVYELVRPTQRAVRAAVALLAVVAVALGLAAPATASGSGSASGRSGSGAHPSPAAQRTASQRSGPTGAGSVSGHVTFPSADDRYDSGHVFVRNHRVHRKVGIDRDGDYSVQGLPDGTYHVIFNRLSGYATAAAQFYDGHDEYEGTQSADDVVVSGGAAVTGINARLHPGGTLTGVLRNPSGAPIPRCLVQAFTPDGSLVTRSARTASDGSFSVGGLTTGAYLVRVSAFYGRGRCDNGSEFAVRGSGGLLGGRAQATAVHITQGRVTSVKSALIYTLAGEISGHVTLPAKAIDRDRFVLARGRGGIHGAAIDSQGNYLIKHVPAGTYRVTFDRLSGQAVAAPLFYRHAFESQADPGGIPSSYTRVSVTAGATATLRGAALVKGGVFAGAVVDETGTPLANCYVQAYTPDDRLVTRTGFTATDGSFSVGGLSTGGYLLRVLPRRTGGCNNHRQFYVGTSRLGGRSGVVAIHATLGRTTTVGSLAFTRGADISGHVTFASGYSRYYDTAVTVRSGHQARTVRADRDGNYLVRGLPAGSYRVTFNRLSGLAVAAAQFYRGHDEFRGVASADRVTVSAGQVLTGINATLHDGGELTGRLVNSSGTPVYCALQAFTPDGSLVTRDGYSYDQDGIGYFDIGGLTTGTYYLRVVPDPYPGAACRQGVQYLGADGTLSNVGPGTPVSVRQGKTRSVGTITYGPRTALVDTAAPTISGTPTVGSVLTASTGTWAPVTPTSYLYAWYSGGTKVPGATMSTYQLQDSDLGHTITVQVTARHPGLTAGTATSAPVGPVTGPSLTLTSKPRISGTPKVGHELTVSPGTVTPTPKRVAYQWLRDGVPVKHATHPTYTLTSADAGRLISVQVTYRKPGYPDLVATTKAVKAH